MPKLRNAKAAPFYCQGAMMWMVRYLLQSTRHHHYQQQQQQAGAVQ